MTLRVKSIYLNNFKTDIIADAIEDSRLDFEDTIDGKGEVSKPREFSHKYWNQWDDSIYNYFASSKNSRGVPLFCVIRKDI